MNGAFYFKSYSSFDVCGHKCFVVDMPPTVKNLNTLIGLNIWIDNVMYRCVGVERQQKATPTQEGEFISVMVKSEDN